MCCSVAQLNCDITVTEWSEKRRPYSEEIHHKGRVRSLQFHTQLTVDSVLQPSYSSQQFPAPFLLRCFHTVFILSHFSWVRWTQSDFCMETVTLSPRPAITRVNSCSYLVFSTPLSALIVTLPQGRNHVNVSGLSPSWITPRMFFLTFYLMGLETTLI